YSRPIEVPPVRPRSSLPRSALTLGVSFAVIAAGGFSLSNGDGSDSLPTRWPIKHVVFVIKENRSFDNLFGRFRGANGARFGLRDGTKVPLRDGVMRIPGRLPHHYEDAIADEAGGRMDGFARNPVARRYAYTQMRPNQIPNYWHW